MDIIREIPNIPNINIHIDNFDIGSINNEDDIFYNSAEDVELD